MARRTRVEIFPLQIRYAIQLVVEGHTVDGPQKLVRVEVEWLGGARPADEQADR